MNTLLRAEKKHEAPSFPAKCDWGELKGFFPPPRWLQSDTQMRKIMSHCLGFRLPIENTIHGLFMRSAFHKMLKRIALGGNQTAYVTMTSTQQNHKNLDTLITIINYSRPGLLDTRSEVDDTGKYVPTGCCTTECFHARVNRAFCM